MGRKWPFAVTRGSLRSEFVHSGTDLLRDQRLACTVTCVNANCPAR